MKQDKLLLVGKETLNGTGRLMKLSFEAPSVEAEPGQFVNIEVPGKYLRRPISVSEYSGGILSLVVDVVGEGTRLMADTPLGERLDMLTGLGRPFSVPDTAPGKDILVIGGGVGYAPLVGLMRKLKSVTGRSPLAVFGFNTAGDVPSRQIESLRAEGLNVEVATMDGGAGTKGNALNAAVGLAASQGLDPGWFYACGPLPMMKAAALKLEFEGELSLEARMGCGFGACMGCSVKTVMGSRRICREGPVFKKTELIW